MYLRKLLAVFGLCVIACLMIGAITPDAYAQNNQNNIGDSDASRSVDKDRATKTGVGGALADGSEDALIGGEGDGPSRLQMGLGLGSCVVMVMVVKWL